MSQAQTQEQTMAAGQGKPAHRQLRPDLTEAEKERFEKYGALEFKSAGAVRDR